METNGQENHPRQRCFRIFVAGRLDPLFIDGIDGIELGHSTDGSTLDGALIDQSHLRGTLERLWQLGIEVLKFETYLSEPNDPRTADGDTPSSPSAGGS